MATPAGTIESDLSVHVSAADGAIDWTMVFPDNTTAKAFSRVVPLNTHSVAYMFVLTAPPVPLEPNRSLIQQAKTLREELGRLKGILEKLDSGR